MRARSVSVTFDGTADVRHDAAIVHALLPALVALHEATPTPGSRRLAGACVAVVAPTDDMPSARETGDRAGSSDGGTHTPTHAHSRHRT